MRVRTPIELDLWRRIYAWGSHTRVQHEGHKFFPISRAVLDVKRRLIDAMETARAS